MYTQAFQSDCSICGYWKDPRTDQGEYQAYLKGCQFLPIINSEVPNSNTNDSRSGFIRLNSHVNLGGPQDQVIAPWQSALYGFYDENLNIVNMTDQFVYQQDTFGLKTLNERKSLHQFSVPNMLHDQWPNVEDVIAKYVLPFLD